MKELVTNRITASALWVPEAWKQYGFTEEQIEMAVAHAVHAGREEVFLLGKGNTDHWFILKDEPLEFHSKSHQGVLEINVYSLTTMTRHYVSLTPEVP
jgi:hypothetical protein